MRSNNILSYVLLIVLVLLVFGVISFGDVLNVVFYIIMGIIFLVLLGVLIVRYKINKIRREMARNGGDPNTAYGSYTNSRRNSSASQGREGEIKVEHTKTERSKVVRNDIGEYVEYEEIDEERKSE